MSGPAMHDEPTDRPAPRRQIETVIPQSEGPKPPKARDPFFDNAKFLAIVLVVIGHAVDELVPMVPTARSAYVLLYLFHMPVFIMIAGYMARRFPSSDAKVRKLIGQLLAPFIIFQIAYLAYDRYLGGKEPELNLLDPYFLTWFLIALFAWRASTPIWQALRWPLAIAVGISVLAGTQELVDEFEMGRVLGLLPFFVLGLLLRPEHFALLRRRWIRVAGAVVLAVAVIGAYFIADRVNTEWLYYRNSNADLGLDLLTGSGLRLALLAGSTLLAFAFLALVPKRSYWFTSFGKWTLYVYLLHGFFVWGAEDLGWYDQAWIGGRIGLAVTVVLAVGVALLLSTRPIRWATGWAIEPNLNWLFRPQRQPANRKAHLAK